MSLKKLSKDSFNSLVDVLISEAKVVGVKSKAEKFNFDVLDSSKELRLDYDVTLQPPKKYFLPPQEMLLTFDDNGYHSQITDEPFILIGVHPYDMVAINQIDELFNQDNCDTHYMARRKNVTIIASDVVNASENVFASSMGTATVESGYDVLLTDIGDSYVAEAPTEKGQAILAKAAGATDATDADIAARKAVWEKNKKELNKHQLKCKPADLPGLLDKAYNHPVWQEKAKTCFGCGSCNLVCPTCYCFNVVDDTNWDLKSGDRDRAWDGCLLNGFTKCAGGHEFRNNQADRFRHRLYRKGKYVPTKIGGQIACVGCGRCVTACLPDIANPVNIYNRLVDDLGIG